MTLLAKTSLSLLIVRTTPITAQCRFVSRQAIHRYVEPNKDEKHMLAAIEPYYKARYQLPSETCKGISRREHDLEPLDKIYADELREEIKKNDFLLFMQHNYAPFRFERVYKNTLIKAGGSFYNHKNRVYRKVFEELGIERLNHLLVARNSLLLGPIDKLPACVKAFRKMPQFLLLAGCINGDVVTYEELQAMSVTSNIDECRANLLATLEAPAITLAHYLEQYSQNLAPDSETPPNDETK